MKVVLVVALLALGALGAVAGDVLEPFAYEQLQANGFGPEVGLQNEALSGAQAAAAPMQAAFPFVAPPMPADMNGQQAAIRKAYLGGQAATPVMMEEQARVSKPEAAQAQAQAEEDEEEEEVPADEVYDAEEEGENEEALVEERAAVHHKHKKGTKLHRMAAKARAAHLKEMDDSDEGGDDDGEDDDGEDDDGEEGDDASEEETPADKLEALGGDKGKDARFREKRNTNGGAADLEPIPPSSVTAGNSGEDAGAAPAAPADKELHKCIPSSTTDCTVQYPPGSVEWKTRTVPAGSLGDVTMANQAPKDKVTQVLEADADTVIENGREFSKNPAIAQVQKQFYAQFDARKKEVDWLQKVRGIIADYQRKMTNVNHSVIQSGEQLARQKKLIIQMIKRDKERRLEKELQTAMQAMQKLDSTSSKLNNKMGEITSTKTGLVNTINKIKTALHGSAALVESAEKAFVTDPQKVQQQQQQQQQQPGQRVYKSPMPRFTEQHLGELSSLIEERARAHTPVTMLAAMHENLKHTTSRAAKAGDVPHARASGSPDPMDDVVQRTLTRVRGEQGSQHTDQYLEKSLGALKDLGII